jgi:hypothetical protein
MGEGRAAVVSLYGREAVEDLELSRAAGLPVDDRAVERIGLDFQIATRLTSWVAVSEEPAVDPRRPARRERMPHALPHGLSIEGLGLRAASAGVPVLALAETSVPYAGMLEETGATFRFASSPSRPARATPGRIRPDRKALGRLTGRLVVRKDRELTFEIDADRDLDWTPEDAKVFWPDGTVRIGVRLTADGPPDTPGRVMVRTRGGLLTVDLRRA